MEWNGGILLYRIFDSKNHAIANCEWWVPVLRPLLTMRNPLMPYVWIRISRMTRMEASKSCLQEKEPQYQLRVGWEELPAHALCQNQDFQD